MDIQKIKDMIKSFRAKNDEDESNAFKIQKPNVNVKHYYEDEIFDLFDDKPEHADISLSDRKRSSQQQPTSKSFRDDYQFDVPIEIDGVEYKIYGDYRDGYNLEIDQVFDPVTKAMISNDEFEKIIDDSDEDIDVREEIDTYYMNNPQVESLIRMTK